MCAYYLLPQDFLSTVNLNHGYDSVQKNILQLEQ